MMMHANSMRLGRLLVGAGVISDEQLAEAAAVADDRPLPHVLDELGFASEKLVAQTVAESMGLPFVDIGSFDIDPTAAILLKSDLMRRYVVLPISVDGDELVVAMADPANIFAIDDVRIVTGKEIRPGRGRRERPGRRDRQVQRLADQRRRHGRRPGAGGRPWRRGGRRRRRRGLGRRRD